jgi:6-phosphofructokinase 1
VVAVSEGLTDKEGNYIAELDGSADSFGHKTLGGVGTALRTIIDEKIDVKDLKTRAIQLNSLQRSAAHCASDVDLDESYQCGFRAVEAAIRGESGIMISIERVSDFPYLIRYNEAKLDDVANKEKKVPQEWINAEGNDVTNEMVTYLSPLIHREASEYMYNGLPQFLRFNLRATVTASEVRG